MKNQVECVLKAAAHLGEGPLWSTQKGLLYWVDINEKQIHAFDPITRKDLIFKQDDLVTALAPRTGGFLAAFRKKIVLLDEDMNVTKTLYEVDKDTPHTRFNDGKCDALGRFWVGTINFKDPNSPSCMLYRATMQQLEPVFNNIVFSNGLSWSSDNTKFFHIETFNQAIFSYDFDLEKGALKNKRVFAKIDKKEGSPDGMTIDEEGGIWCAHYGGGQLVRFDKNGKITEKILLPVPNITCCTFGGENLETLYITTARENLNPEQLKKYPLSGGLFAIKVNYRGTSAHEFRAK